MDLLCLGAPDIVKSDCTSLGPQFMRSRYASGEGYVEVLTDLAREELVDLTMAGYRGHFTRYPVQENRVVATFAEEFAAVRFTP